MPDETESMLTEESKRAIRSYLLRLVTLPAIAVSIASFVLGLSIQEGTAGRATFDAIKTVLPPITDATKAAAEAQASAKSTLSDAQQTAANLKSLKELQEALQQSDKLVTAIAETLKNDPTFAAKLAADFNDRMASHAKWINYIYTKAAAMPREYHANAFWQRALIDQSKQVQADLKQ